MRNEIRLFRSQCAVHTPQLTPKYRSSGGSNKREGREYVAQNKKAKRSSGSSSSGSNNDEIIKQSKTKEKEKKTTTSTNSASNNSNPLDGDDFDDLKDLLANHNKKILKPKKKPKLLSTDIRGWEKR